MGDEAKEREPGAADCIAGGGGGGRLQVRRRGPARLTAAMRRRFLDVLAATANAQRAAGAAGAAPSAFYRLRYRDEGFSEAWREALESAMVRLEGEVLAHALGERGEEPRGDAERAGEAGRVDITVAMELLKRRGAMGRGVGRTPAGRAQRRRMPIAEVEKLLLGRLSAMARQDGRE